MRIYLTALGCKLNQAEISEMARQFVSRGHNVVDDPTYADWAIVNTCTVTHIAARKTRQLARSLHKRAPALRIALTGCYVRMSTSEAASLAGVELVLTEKAQVVDAIMATSAEADAASGCEVHLAPQDLDGHTRAFVKVQDGCDNHCAYCIVTVARGPAQSASAELVLDSVRRRVTEGYREVVLTGINIGAYGREGGQIRGSLAELVARILGETSVQRLRLSSIEPPELTPELVALWPEERLCRHVHLCLQSGCDATLRAMGRKYTSGEFAERVAMLRRASPGISLTTDVIVGFPGETDADFEASLAFCRDMTFSRMHVFKYSRRDGTRAARMKQQVPAPVIQERSERMIAMGREMAAAYHDSYVRQTVQVLAETDQTEGSQRVWSGLTDTYVRVRFDGDCDLRNRLVMVRIDQVNADGLRGAMAATCHPGQ